jgi:hypothetical protein
MFTPIDGRIPTQEELNQAIEEFKRQMNEGLDRQEAERGENEEGDDEDDDDSLDINVTVATNVNVEEWQNADLNIDDAKIDVILLDGAESIDSNTRGNVVIIDIRTNIEKEVIGAIGEQFAAQLPPGFHFAIGKPSLLGGRLHAPSGGLYFARPPNEDDGEGDNNNNK